MGDSEHVPGELYARRAREPVKDSPPAFRKRGSQPTLIFHKRWEVEDEPLFITSSSTLLKLNNGFFFKGRIARVVEL